MALSFSTRPQNRFYSYLIDGHIYSISSTEPDVIADGGGYYNCYFQVTPYYKVGDEYYPLYEQTTDANDKKVYTLVTANSFNRGNTYCYPVDNNTYTSITITEDTKYYSKNGKYEYKMPNDASDLPYVDYKAEDSTTTYRHYMDTLITTGATYNGSQFMPLDTTTGDAKTTFGDLLNEKIVDSISASCFVSNVSSLPAYITDSTHATFSKTDFSNYTVPDLKVGGELFLQKLTAVMKEAGDAILSKYTTNLTITTEVTTNKSTIITK